MEEILIFRSAKHVVVKECIEKINEKYKECSIWLCIQEQCINTYSEYENINFIVFPNGMFSYENTVGNKKICNMLTEKNFDEVCIPYSSAIPKCEEIEKIILYILKRKKAVYFGRDNILEKKRIHIGNTLKDITTQIYENIDYAIMCIIYFFYERRGKNVLR